MSVLISVVDEESRLQGYLAIDSMINGRCYGGFRMAPDLLPAILPELARVMTLKHGFLGLPLGGAKAAIVANPEVPLKEKRQLLKAFGKALMPFLKTRSYVPGGDLGISDDDIRFMLTSNRLKVQSRSLTKRSGFYTGLTVFSAVTRAAQHIGLDLNQASVAIEGFGAVGGSAAQVFWEKGLRVVAISTNQGAIYAQEGLDVGELVKLRNQVGNRVVKVYRRADQIEKEQLLELEVDFLCPCASPHSVTVDNASRVAAKIIVPGANAPITADAEQILFQRGILSIPDFVANCGGALGVSMEVAGLGEDFVRHFIDQRFGQRVTEVIEAAEKKGVIPRDYAQRIAEEKFLQVKESSEKGSIVNKAFDFALGLYGKGVIPHQLVRLLSPRYFERRLG